MRKTGVLCLLMCLVLLIAAKAFADDAANFQRTIKKHCSQSAAAPSNAETEKYAGQLMLIKNGMSSYRDKALSPEQINLLRSLVDNHLQYSNAAISGMGTQKYRTLNGLIHYNSLFASYILNTEPDKSSFKSLMEKYHSTIGYNAYIQAKELGIYQVWDEK